MSNAIKAGDQVEEVGTDSGVWLVTNLYRESPLFQRKAFAQLVLPGKPNCTAHVPLDRLVRVGPWR